MTKEENQTQQSDQNPVRLSPENLNLNGTTHGNTEQESDLQLTISRLQKENSELRKMHNDLERSLLNFTNLFDFAPTAYFTLDSKFSITEVNHAACKLLACKREDLLEMAVTRFIVPEDQEDFFHHLRDLGIHNGRNTCDLHMIKPDGEQLLLHVESVATITSKGKTAYRLTAIDITESNVLTESIAHSRDFQQAILEDMPSLVWRSGPTGEFDYFNKTWLAFTGRTIEQEEGEGWLYGMHPEDLHAFSAALRQAYADKQPFNSEFRLSRHDGEYRWISAKAHPFYNVNKEFVGFICACYDINERLLDEITIKKQNAFLNNVLESLTHPFCIIDAEDYSIIKANSAATEVYGKLDHTHCFTIMHGLQQPCDTSNYLCTLNLVRKTNKSTRVEHTHIDKNGIPRIMDVYGYPIFGEDGKLSQVIEYSFDITERKNTEEALKVELEIRKALAEVAFETLSTPMSMEEIMKAVHRHALSLTGCDLGFTGALYTDRSVMYALGDSASTLLACPRIEELPFGLSKIWLAACKDPRVEGEMSVRNPVSRKPARILSIPAIAKGQVLGLIVLYAENRKFGPDIIEIIHRLASLYALSLLQMHTSEELNTAKARAEESDMLKSVFLSNMSHDIRTPMNAIIGFSEMLQDLDISREESLRFLEIIVNSGNALIRLINDIIDISKIEVRQLKMIKSDFSLNELLSDLYLSYSEELIRNKREDIHLVIHKQHPEKDYTLHTDPVRLRQIFSNLIGNALKFTDQGTIEFGYSFSDPQVFCFFVRDTGIGIPKDKMDLIFERFGQIEETRDRNKGGTGLGLAISKSLTEILGGVLWVESEVGVGTSFYFTLPDESSTISSEASKEMPKALDPNLFDWTGKVILIAEDVESNYFLIETILKKTGARLIWAKNGKQAYEMCREDHAIDLVLMDIQMPVMNGYDSTREIKKIRPSLPVIAQTAYAMSGEKEKSIAAGCDDYLPKPIKKKDLLLRINRLFSS
jgi:PAS domain S-box-containing protein